jgi:heme exporter protein A
MNSLSFNLSCQKGYHTIFENKIAAIQSGDILQLTGHNGSGKTSLLKIIAQLNKDDTGEIVFNDKKIDHDFLEHCYYLGHKSAINPQLTVFENLAFLTSLKKKLPKKNILKALEQVGLAYYVDEFCQNLSAGQQRRVALASLFLSSETIWLLDEPFTALDIEGVKMIEEVILNHTKNDGICIFTTHQKAKLFEPMVLEL